MILLNGGLKKLNKIEKKFLIKLLKKEHNLNQISRINLKHQKDGLIDLSKDIKSKKKLMIY